MTDITALLIAVVSLYSTGHWIGGTVMLLVLLMQGFANYQDPTGLIRMFNAFRN